MKNFTDEQIIKALEYCVYDTTCQECPYNELSECISVRHRNLLGLINRQKAEIKSLKQIIDENDKEILKLQKRIVFWREDLNYQPEKIRSEAIKEFAERLKEESYSNSDICGYTSTVVDVNSIDNLVKEMTERK